jgi:hypothetical protein
LHITNINQSININAGIDTEIIWSHVMGRIETQHVLNVLKPRRVIAARNFDGICTDKLAVNDVTL